ncbi:hypothetical protein CSB69_3180 [Morganella morganii]|nr:hypothetical protein CSB69_3180 [Morganella morganii]EMP53389.1 hypothetical protein C790_01580 [Morganella morganii SC01]
MCERTDNCVYQNEKAAKLTKTGHSICVTESVSGTFQEDDRF